jgi:predicted RNase H-like nuclease (RuvC/YqgF family)
MTTISAPWRWLIPTNASEWPDPARAEETRLRDSLDRGLSIFQSMIDQTRTRQTDLEDREKGMAERLKALEPAATEQRSAVTSELKGMQAELDRLREQISANERNQESLRARIAELDAGATIEFTGPAPVNRPVKIYQFNSAENRDQSGIRPFERKT